MTLMSTILYVTSIYRCAVAIAIRMENIRYTGIRAAFTMLKLEHRTINYPLDMNSILNSHKIFRKIKTYHKMCVVKIVRGDGRRQNGRMVGIGMLQTVPHSSLVLTHSFYIIFFPIQFCVIHIEYRKHRDAIHVEIVLAMESNSTQHTYRAGAFKYYLPLNANGRM